MTRLRIRALALAAGMAAAHPFASTQTSVATAPAETPARPHVMCTVDRSLPNEGDLDLARKDYPAAETFFRAAIKSSNFEDAHLGLVRALIGKNDVAGARAEADAMLAQHPQSALAEVALSESAYRAAAFTEAMQHVSQALQLNACEGRAAAAAAHVLELSAMFADETKYLATAHSLRPDDELIRRSWIDSLPRKQREIELAKYLDETKALSDDDRKGYSNEEEHLKARRPGECRITSKADTVNIPFQPIYESANVTLAYGLDVVLNGKRRRMQIDTGASGIVLTPAAAKRLGLEPEYRLKSGGVGDQGEVGSYLTHIAKIQIGDVEVSDCMVEVLEKAKLDVDGLIGIDVFDRWLVTLDYPNSQLRLAPLPPRPGAKTSAPGALTDDRENGDSHIPQNRYIAPEMQDWLRIVRINHELLLPARIGTGPAHYLMADTGASRSTFSTTFAKEGGKIHEDSDVTFSGISGDVKKVYRIDNAALQFGSLRIPPTSYWVFDLTRVSHDTGAEISGFVGLPTLSRLTISIDYRDNLMQLKYDPKHDVQRF